MKREIANIGSFSVGAGMGWDGICVLSVFHICIQSEAKRITEVWYGMVQRARKRGSLCLDS
jgi:hypothetical protein